MAKYSDLYLPPTVVKDGLTLSLSTDVLDYTGQATDGFSISSYPGISFGQGASFTVESIFETNVLGETRMLFRKGETDSSTTTDYNMFYGNNKFAYGIGSSADPSAWRSTTLFNEVNKIFCASMTISSTGAQTGTMAFYKNGVLVESSPYTTKAPITTNPLNIGKSVTDSFNWNGKIYLVRVYNRALSSEEVATNFEAIKNDYTF